MDGGNSDEKLSVQLKNNISKLNKIYSLNIVVKPEIIKSSLEKYRQTC